MQTYTTPYTKSYSYEDLFLLRGIDSMVIFDPLVRGDVVMNCII